MKVYKFMYTDCIHESSYATYSIHKTLKGAYVAMRKHMTNEYVEWYDTRLMYGKDRFKFGFDVAWCVRSVEVLD